AQPDTDRHSDAEPLTQPYRHRVAASPGPDVGASVAETVSQPAAEPVNVTVAVPFTVAVVVVVDNGWPLIDGLDVRGVPESADTPRYLAAINTERRCPETC